MLAERGALRPNLSVEEGRDGLWTLTSLAVWDLLVTARGWSAARYERWLADRLADLLLVVGGPGPSSQSDPSRS
jgi:hypothetical protein